MTLTHLDTRSRTHEWADPSGVLARAAQLSGREALEAMIAGDLPYPPLGSTMDFSSLALEGDEVVLGMHPQEHHYNGIGMVHGGVLATMLDTVCGCAVQLTVPAGGRYSTLDLNTRFLRAVTIESGFLTARGTLVHRGSRLRVANGTITDDSGRVVATATSACMILA